MIDYNCYVGQWPFHKLRRYTFEDLVSVHKENGIEYGYVSSIHSIFYNDFYESEKDLYEQIKGSSYKQVTLVNPTLSACIHTLKRCVREFDIKGIRILPVYHGYDLNSDVLKPVIDVARENNLPLFITARMIDERITHMICPEVLCSADIKQFIERNPDITIVLSHLKDGEAGELEDVLSENPRLFTDTSGFAGNLLLDEGKLYRYKKAVLGTGFPLKTVKSQVLRIEKEIKEFYDTRFDVDVLKR